MAKRSKPIHLIRIKFNCVSRAVCSPYEVYVRPIESNIVDYICNDIPKGTFDANKVTCKRCLKHKDYKELKEKQNNPLFFWRE